MQQNNPTSNIQHPTSQSAIIVKNLTKVYHLYDSPKDRLKEALNPFKKSYHHDFYALKDVSFEIKKGETVGIIGKNGAGKSTLLKMITGVLTPTSGSVEVNGKIASLLELGAGFNPEMTGMENIFLNGTIMGFTKEEMDSKVDAILEFADIGEFIDQPVKMYSSGMFARLAFSVAINVEPDVLIVDEALSVGDMYFQQKCMDKINSMQVNKLTLLFVSHSISQIKKMCKTAIYLENGSIIDLGDSNKVCDLYLNQTTNISSGEKEKALKKVKETISKKENIVLSERLENDFFRIDPEFSKKYTKRSGGKELEFTAMDIYDKDDQIINEIIGLDLIKVRCSFITNNEIPKGFAVGLLCRDFEGNDMFSCNSNHYEVFFNSIDEGQQAVFEFSFIFPLLHGHSGQYTFSIGVKPEPYSDYFYDRVFNGSIFKVSNPKFADNIGGLVYVKPKIKYYKKI